MDTPFTWAPNRCANKSTFNAKPFSKLSKLSHISAYITWSLLSSGWQRLLNAITPPILHKQPRDQAIRVKFNMSYTIADINIQWIALNDPCDIRFSNGLPRLCSTKSRTLEYRNKNTCFSGVNRLVSKAKYDTDTHRYWYCCIFYFTGILRIILGFVTWWSLKPTNRVCDCATYKRLPVWDSRQMALANSEDDPGSMATSTDQQIRYPSVQMMFKRVLSIDCR